MLRQLENVPLSTPIIRFRDFASKICCNCTRSLLAHCVISRQRSNRSLSGVQQPSARSRSRAVQLRRLLAAGLSNSRPALPLSQDSKSYSPSRVMPVPRPARSSAAGRSASMISLRKNVAVAKRTQCAPGDRQGVEGESP